MHELLTARDLKELTSESHVNLLRTAHGKPSICVTADVTHISIIPDTI